MSRMVSSCLDRKWGAACEPGWAGSDLERRAAEPTDHGVEERGGESVVLGDDDLNGLAEE